jgi:hypothetical protein
MFLSNNEIPASTKVSGRFTPIDEEPLFQYKMTPQDIDKVRLLRYSKNTALRHTAPV